MHSICMFPGVAIPAKYGGGFQNWESPTVFI